MRHLAAALVAGLVLAQPLAANPPHGSAKYQRAIRCSGVAMAAMVYAVEVESAGRPLVHDGKPVRFAAPETYQRSSNRWLAAAVRTGEFDSTAARRDRADESQQIGALVDRSSDRARELAMMLKEFAGCR